MTSDKMEALIPRREGGADRLEVQVYKALFDKIRFGTYALGEKLPSEHALGEEHEVSRPVIRAALSKLRDSGLIVSRRGAGSYVNSGVPTDTGGYSPLGSIADVADYFRFRRTIEGAVAELAARNGTPKAAGQLRDIAGEIPALLSSGRDAVGVDIKFHATLAELSDSRFLIESVELIRPHWVFIGNFVRSLGATRDRTGKRMTDEHMAIADAIEARDPARARRAMISHVDSSERRVFKEDR